MAFKPNHKVAISDLYGFVGSVTMASSAGRGSSKNLSARVTSGDSLSACYVVYSHQKVVYEGSCLADAIIAYNNEP